MNNPIGHRSEEGESPPRLIGNRTVEEVRELLRRRGLAFRTAGMYIGLLARAESFCRGAGVQLDELDGRHLNRFAATLPQTPSSLRSARAALAHYWSAIGRPESPILDVVGLLGAPSKDHLEREVAAEAAAMREDSELSAPTWSEMGYDRPWLLARLRERDLGQKTAHGYVTRLSHLAKWAVKHGSTIDTLSGPELEAYAAELPLTRSTRMGLRCGLIHYFAVTQRYEWPLWAVKVPRSTRMVCRALEDGDARTLELAALTRDDRKGLAVIIGLYLGLRRFEISKLQWTDFEDGWLCVVGKFDLEASIPVHPVVRNYLERQGNSSRFVFPGRFGGSVNPNTLWGWVKEVAAEAGVGDVSTHILRHTALATANDETGDLRSVQDFARHAEPTTTSGYTRTTKRRIQAVADAIGGFYGRGDGCAEAEVADPGPPGLPFAELVRALEGSHAVSPWLELQAVMVDRPGWSLQSLGDGSAAIQFAFEGGKLSADVRSWTSDRPPGFVVQCVVGPTEEDFVWWELRDAGSLGALLATFEAGGVPFPPSGECVAEPDPEVTVQRV